MTTAISTLRLLQISDSAFPTGAFAFSNGLETLAAESRAKDRPSVEAIFQQQILPRWSSFDRVFLRHAHAQHDDIPALLGTDHRCHLQNTAHTLAAASRRMGRAVLTMHVRLGTPGASAFAEALRECRGPDTGGYDPVVQGMVGANLGLTSLETESAALHSMAAAYFSAAIRLGVIGAIEAQEALADAAPTMAACLTGPAPDDACSASLLAEIAALRRDSARAALFAT